MRKLLVLLLLPISVWAANSDSVTQTILQSVKGTKVLKVTLHTVPNSDAVKMTIHTSAGKKSLIVAKKHVVPALRALSTPKLIGHETTTQHRPAINTYTNMQHTPETIAATKVSARPNAAAIVTTNVMSANQQASK